MKIEVAKPDIESALQVVSVGTASSGADLTTHYVFRIGKGGVVEVLSNNGRLGCSMPLGAASVEGEEGAAFTVESWRLNKWIAAIQGVVKLELDGGNVRATSSKGTVKFQTLDASQFRYWDETFSEAPGGTSLPARRLHTALNHVRLFISDKDTTTPKLAVTEILNESLQATDKGSLAVVTIEPLKESNLRIHGKDLGPVLSFLGASGDGNISVSEHDKCLFLVREDGGVLSVSRPLHAFPEIKLDRKLGDPHWWTIKTDDLQSSIKALAASASKEDTRLTFKLEDGQVGLTMRCASGDNATLHLEAVEHGSEEDAAPMPDAGFDVAYPYLLKLLGQYRGETIRFGLNPQVDKKTGKHKGGWVRFREDREGDDYLTMLVWML